MKEIILERITYLSQRLDDKRVLTTYYLNLRLLRDLYPVEFKEKFV